MSDQWSYCPRCGVKLIDTGKFCHACGTAVNHEEQTQPEPLQRKPEEELAKTPETPTKAPEIPIETRSQTEEIKEQPWRQQTVLKNLETYGLKLRPHWVVFVLASLFAVGLVERYMESVTGIPLGLWGAVGYLGAVYVVSTGIALALVLLLTVGLWNFLLKSALTLGLYFVTILIAAAGVELFFGVPRPGYTAIIGFAMSAPLLYYKVWGKTVVRSMPQSRRFGKLFAWSSVAVMVVLMIGTLGMLTGDVLPIEDRLNIEPQTEASGIEKPRRVPPIRGEAELGYTTPVTRNTNTEIVTVIKVKNLSTTNSIVGLKVDEYWYDREGNPLSGDQYRHRQPLMPEEVIEVTLRTPINPSMDRNQYQFEHANGSMKTTLVPSL